MDDRALSIMRLTHALRQVCTVGWLLLRLLPLRLVSGRRGRHLPGSAQGQLEGVLAAARDDFTIELNGAHPTRRLFIN